jgi:hypothetical protein
VDGPGVGLLTVAGWWRGCCLGQAWLVRLRGVVGLVVGWWWVEICIVDASIFWCSVVRLWYVSVLCVG